MLVGTAMTGTCTSPATTEGSAPSMPAMTTTEETAGDASSGSWDTMRCRPATPQSKSRTGCTPHASRVSAHSSATGMSVVPAVTTRMVLEKEGGGGEAGEGGTVMQRPEGQYERVDRKEGEAPEEEGRLWMEAHASGVILVVGGGVRVDGVGLGGEGTAHRVASTADSDFAASDSRIVATCSGVLLEPNTTSGKPVRACRVWSRRASGVAEGEEEGREEGAGGGADVAEEGGWIDA
jgi:hypothetical protein